MVRFKVIRASKLLLWISIIVLLAVISFTVLRYALIQPKDNPTATLVESEAAKTMQVFAASDDRKRENDQLSLDPITIADDMHIEIIPDTESISDQAEAPRILIYHTHTHEAYEQTSQDAYIALEAWRTDDINHSVVRVGKELAEALEAYGFIVTHDTTDHEGDDLSNAYTRSLETLEKYRNNFDLYIDLHRDAYVEGTEICHIDQNKQKKAPLMMLIGNGEGFDEKPSYQENRVFAEKLTERINKLDPGLCKKVLIKDGRYNQHIDIFSILIEVGHNRNTLSQALNSIAVLAESIYMLMIDSPDLVIEHLRVNHDAGMQ